MVVEHAKNAMGWPFYLRTGRCGCRIWPAHNHPGHMNHPRNRMVSNYKLLAVMDVDPIDSFHRHCMNECPPKN